MLKLAKYSIETDKTVLLQFADGSDKRISPERLVEYVTGDDLSAVQAAFKVRKTFLKRHLPKLVIIVAAGGIISLIGLSQQKELNILMHHSDPKSLVEHHPDLTSYAHIIATPKPSQSTNVLSAAVSPSPAITPSNNPSIPPSSHKTHSKHHLEIKVFNLRLPSL
jgi:hypothetical protein